MNPKSLENLIPFQPGQSGNPEGRRAAGAYIKDWINSFANSGLNAEQLRKIARDKDESWTRRAAAERILRTMESPDLADFQEAVDGGTDLKSLRDRGLNTEVVKKMKVKTRTNDKGDTEVEREIELHDRAGEDFDRIMDRTEGKPHQTTDVTSGGKPISIETTADRILALIAGAGKPAGAPTSKPE